MATVEAVALQVFLNNIFDKLKALERLLKKNTDINELRLRLAAIDSMIAQAKRLIAEEKAA